MKGKIVKSVKMVFKNGNDYEASTETGLDKGEVVDWVKRVFEVEQPKPKPLIKSLKIRKAVRAWADANGYDKLWVYLDHTVISFYNEEDNDNEIIFNTVEKFGLEHGKCYTITELCGEEEE